MAPKVNSTHKRIRVLISLLLALSFLATGGLSLITASSSAQGASTALSAPLASTSQMVPGTVPHYFGPYANYANSPVPTGSIASILVNKGGSGYTAPVVTISDAWGTGSGAVVGTTTVSGGAITSIGLSSGGTKYSAPVVTIKDSTGTGATATATIGGSLTGGIRKFVDSLPGLGSSNANDLGNYIPIGVPDTTTYPGCDYYEIALVRYTQKMSIDLPPTLLNGYVQLETSANYALSKHVALTNPDGSPILKANGTRAIGFDRPYYLGPTIVASRNIPVRVTFHNLLPTGSGGDLFLPVDTTVMGAGMGPLNMTGMPGMKENYTQNRATLHLHGGATPWISDGTPDQWTTPAGEVTQYPTGVSVQYVPDMWFVNGKVVPNTVGNTTQPVAGASNNPGPGSLTFYYTNQQSARLMFYHDHAYGITRLNVYSGEAAAYLLTDSVENSLIASGVIPSQAGAYLYGIPLVIQDKTFVDATTIPSQDPTWGWGSHPANASNPTGTPTTGDLWYPHVYMPNQNPSDPSGANPYGRWDYGPWFFPPTTDITQGPVLNPYYDPVNAPWEPRLIPGVPKVSSTMEAFMDTPVVNGQAYPYMTVDPQAYRFRILNAANDRFFNLQVYVADPNVTTSDGRHNTEVNMIPAVQPIGSTVTTLPTVPNPYYKGPDIVQIGTEGGFLPAPVVIPDQPITWNNDMKTFTFGNVKDHSLLLGSAERADVIIDFSKYAGKTLILYNDAPAGFPAYDSRSDYYTGDLNQMDSGGAPTTQAGFGPNTRTIMQIRVSGNVAAPAFNVTALKTAWATTSSHTGVFASDEDPIIVPQSVYNTAYNKTFSTNAFVRIQDTSMTFTTLSGTNLTIPLQPKAIHDEMGGSYDPVYGRMSGSMGLEVPSGNAVTQQFIPLGYASPPVDLLADSMVAMTPVLGDGTQIWKITHNGVDTHAIHWHLFNVELINRVGWDGMITPPDLNEIGWKDTVRVDPLSDTIVAMRPVAPTLPWEVPSSYRLIDPTLPEGAVLQPPPGGFFDPNANAVTVLNHYVNYGWEYVWHCHLLEHEEMDMMHSMPFAVAPWAPSGLVNIPNPLHNTWVNLTWIDNSIAETGYIVQRNSTVSPLWTTIGTIPSPHATTGPTKGNVMHFNDTVVLGGIVYNYRVMANSIIGDPTTYGVGIGYPTLSINSTASNVLTFPNNLPGRPTLVSAVAGNAKVTLTWTAPSSNGGLPILGYKLYRGTVSGGETLYATLGNVLTLVDNKNIVNGVTYYYKVSAFNSAGQGPPSNELSAKPFATTVPTAPTLVSTVAGNAKVTLTWTAPSSNGGSAIIGYRVYRGTTAGGETLYATLGNVLTVVNNKNIVNGVTYYYKIAAFNVVGQGPLSNERSATPTAGATVPSAPTLVSAVAGNAKVTLTWTAPSSNGGSAILGYRVYRGTTAGGETLYSTLGNVLTVVNTKNIVNGVTYYYKIAAYNVVGQGPLSNELKATPSALLAVAAAVSAPSPLHQQGTSIGIPTSAVDTGQIGWTSAATAARAIQAGTSIISDRNAWRSTY